MQHDKHVVKMIVESAQMLSTCHRVKDGIAVRIPSNSGKRMIEHFTLNDKRENLIYKVFGKNHPCNIWLRDNSENYHWLFLHFGALLNEYTERYNKRHKSQALLIPLMAPPLNMSRVKSFTFPPLCMPDQYKTDDPIESYRAYYRAEKAPGNTWKRNKPEWL